MVISRAGVPHKNDKSILLGQGNTPLHASAERGHTQVVQHLILYKANLHSLNRAKDTPLHLAAANGHEACVRELLSAGANAKAKNKLGRTPRECAHMFGHQTIVQLFDNFRKGTIPDPPTPDVYGFAFAGEDITGKNRKQIKQIRDRKKADFEAVLEEIMNELNGCEQRIEIGRETQNKQLATLNAAFKKLWGGEADDLSDVAVEAPADVTPSAVCAKTEEGGEGENVEKAEEEEKKKETEDEEESVEKAEEEEAEEGAAEVAKEGDERDIPTAPAQPAHAALSNFLESFMGDRSPLSDPPPSSINPHRRIVVADTD